MQNNKNQKMDEDCPPCKMTEEAVGNLSALDKRCCSLKVFANGVEKKFTKKITFIILVLAMIIGGVVVYGLFSKPSEELIEANLSDELLTEDTSIAGIASPEEKQPADNNADNGEESELPNNTLFLPDFTTTDILGNQVSLSDFQGKTPVLLVFWATWCSFCQQELEDLNNFTLKHKDEIKVFAIASAEPKSTVKKYSEEKDVDFTLLLDETREIWNQYLVRGTPSHFLINKKGEVLTVFPGLATADNLETMFNMLVE